MDLRDQTQVTEHGSKRLSPSSHLTSPTPCSFKMGLLHHGNIRCYETAQLRGPSGPHVPSDSKDTESGRELAKSQPEECGDSPVDKSICCSIMNLTQYSHKKSAMALRACKPIDVVEVGVEGCGFLAAGLGTGSVSQGNKKSDRAGHFTSSSGLHQCALYTHVRKTHAHKEKNQSEFLINIHTHTYHTYTHSYMYMHACMGMCTHILGTHNQCYSLK